MKELKILQEWKHEFKNGIEKYCRGYPAVARSLLKLSTDIETLLHQQAQLTRELTIKECINLSDKLEAGADTEFNEWRAFKEFRNTLHDKLNQND